MLNEFLDKLYSAVTSLSTDTLLWIAWGSFAFVFLLSFILGLKVRAVKEASKRPFLCLVNAYTAITFAVFLTENGIEQSIFAATLFWLVGYLLYGALCFVARSKKPRVTAQPPAVVVQPAAPFKPARQPVKDVPAAKSSVRLEHAVSVTDKLLTKNLARSDRQELEKLKNTLAVLQMKGTLSPSEAEILNDNFNALLKLMAKYNI